MISEKDLNEMEALGLDEKISRVEKLLEGKNSPRAMELGLFLALHMAKELKTGRELGSSTGKMVADWMRRYSPESVEESIALAKQFFTDSSKIAERIRREVSSENA